jgi:hypothetical protein
MVMKLPTFKLRLVATLILALSSCFHTVLPETIAQSTTESVAILDEIAAQQASSSSSSSSSSSASASLSSCFIPRDSTQLTKQVWTVGVLAIRGEADAYDKFNSTFATYLTATAGQRFDPPIEFRMKPLDFVNVFTDSEQGLVDFIYVNPSLFSCIESEYVSMTLWRGVFLSVCMFAHF